MPAANQACGVGRPCGRQHPALPAEGSTPALSPMVARWRCVGCACTHGRGPSSSPLCLCLCHPIPSHPRRGAQVEALADISAATLGDVTLESLGASFLTTMSTVSSMQALQMSGVRMPGGSHGGSGSAGGSGHCHVHGHGQPHSPTSPRGSAQASGHSVAQGRLPVEQGRAGHR